MSYKLTRNALLIGLSFSAASCAFAETTPDSMTCKEFVDLNPKAASPVVYWVASEDIINKQGDSFDIEKVDTYVTPQVFALCKESPQRKVSSFKQEIKDFVKKHM